MTRLRMLEPTRVTTPNGEELILLTLTPKEWESLNTLLHETTSLTELEEAKVLEENNLLELVERLELLEADESPENKQAWQEAIHKAKPAHYVPGQGIVIGE